MSESNSALSGVKQKIDFQVAFYFVKRHFPLIELEDILSKSRVSEIVICRLILAKYLRALKYSLPKIGLILNRKHCTIIHLLKKAETTTDSELIRILVIMNTEVEDLIKTRGKIMLDKYIEYHENEIKRLKMAY